MDKARERHIAEMNRLEDAISRTKSYKLKRDYTKTLNRMRKELIQYDRYHNAGIQS